MTADRRQKFITYTVVRPDSRPDLKLVIRLFGRDLQIYTEGNMDNRYIYLEPKWLEIYTDAAERNRFLGKKIEL